MESVLKDEREDIQKKTFTKWFNSQLCKKGQPLITDLFFDLKDGTKLLALLGILTNKQYKHEKGGMRVHKLSNVRAALDILAENNVKLVNISADHIVDGSSKITLALVWAVILHWQVEGLLKDVMADLQLTSLEKTLLAWCRQTTKDYVGVDIRNFSSSWSDGLAFNALLHKNMPHLFEWTALANKPPYARLQQAFNIAQENFGIDKLLDPEDVNTQTPDKKSIMMYVMCLFQALPHSSISAAEAMDLPSSHEGSPIKQESSKKVTVQSEVLQPYLQKLESVLSWMGEAEEIINGMGEIGADTDVCREQFHELEAVMMELTKRQLGVGEVLREGTELRKVLGEGVAHNEIINQMVMLNSRWEHVRKVAMERQMKLHAALMTKQEEEVESLKKWLTATEDRISKMATIGPTLDAVSRQLEDHKKLQDDLEAEQAKISKLNNIVLIVEDKQSEGVESAYCQLEDELQALGERWGHICRWSEEQWAKIQAVEYHWKKYQQGLDQLTSWLQEKEQVLRKIESDPSSEEEHMMAQATVLQRLQCELEVNCSKLSNLKEQGSAVLAGINKPLPSTSSEHDNAITEQLEDLQDRWDCLQSIIEAMKIRLAKFGIDVSTTVVIGGATGAAGKDNGVSKGGKSSSIVTRVITTKSVASHPAPTSPDLSAAGDVKRQKTIDDREEFIVSEMEVTEQREGKKTENIKEDEVTTTLLQKLSSLEASLVPSATLNKSETELLELKKTVQEELRGLEVDSEKVSASSRAKVEAQCQALHNMLCRLERQSVVDSDEQAVHRVEMLKEQYNALVSWFEKYEASEQPLEQLKARHAEVQGCAAATHRLLLSVSERLPSPHAHREYHFTLIESLTSLAQECTSLQARYESALKDKGVYLQDAEKSSSIPGTTVEVEMVEVVDMEGGSSNGSSKRVIEKVETFVEEVVEVQVEGLEQLHNWLDQVEAEASGAPVMAMLDDMQKKLAAHKNNLTRVKAEEERLTGHQLEMSNKIDGANQSAVLEVYEKVEAAVKHCQKVKDILEMSIAALAEGVEFVKQHEDEMNSLHSWLADVKVFLKAEEDHVAGHSDLETLKAQLQQSEALQDDIKTLSSNLASVEQSRNRVQSESTSVSEDLKEHMIKSVSDLRIEWDEAVGQATLLHGKLQEMTRSLEESHTLKQEISSWLQNVKVPSSKGIETSRELQTAIQSCEAIKKQCLEKLDSVNILGLSDQDELCQKLKDLENLLAERLDALFTISKHYEVFKDLSSKENRWLSDLESKLEQWAAPAADAEEISAKLDELESFLRQHSREEQLDEVTEKLLSAGVMTVTVQNSDHTTDTRRKQLLSKSEAVQKSLEAASVVAQECEQLYLTALERVSSLLQTLQQEEEDYSIDTLRQILIAEEQTSISKLKHQLENYENEGNKPAAERLRQQLQLVQSKCDDLKSVISGFENVTSSEADNKPDLKTSLSVSSPPCAPRGLNPYAKEPVVNKRASVELCGKVEDLRQQLIDTGEKAKTIKLSSTRSEHVQEQLTQCLLVYRELSEVKTTVESTLASGRRLVKEGLVSQPHTLSSQLDDLKALYNKLGSEVTQLRGELEEAVQQVRRLERDISAADKLISSTEIQLKSDKITSVKLQQCLEELKQRRPLLTSICESSNYLTGLAGGAVTYQGSEEINQRWEACVAACNERITKLGGADVGSGGEEKEGDVSQFILRLADIKAWLEGTELRINQEIPQQERLLLLKSLEEEVAEYGSSIEAVKSSGARFASHGTLYHESLAPELKDISTRWQSINDRVQRRDGGGSVTSSSSTTTISSSSNTVTTITQHKITTEVQHQSKVHSTAAQSPSSPAAWKKTALETDDISCYLREVTALVDKIAALRMKAQVVPVVSQALNNAQSLEHEVCLLEPDVATVVSRGDTLTLAAEAGRAQDIRAAVQELRTSWQTLKAQAESVKAESEQVTRELSTSSERVSALVSWLNDISKRLQAPCLSQQARRELQNEIESHRSEVESLNATSALLTKYRHQQLHPSLTVVNTRWTEVTTLCRQITEQQGSEGKNFHQSLQKGKYESSGATASSVVPDYVATVNRVRESVSLIARQAKPTQHPYLDLASQAEMINKLQERLSYIKVQVEQVEDERPIAIKAAANNQAMVTQVRKVLDNLRQEWSQSNRAVSNLHATYLQHHTTWQSLHSNMAALKEWLEEAKTRLDSTDDESLPQARLTQKELEKQVTLKHRMFEKMERELRQVLEDGEGLPHQHESQLSDRVTGLLDDWKALLHRLAARRERLSGEGSQYESLNAWLMESKSLVNASVNATDEAALVAHINMLQKLSAELPEKRELTCTLREVRPAIATDEQVKQLNTALTEVSAAIPNTLQGCETKLNVVRTVLEGAEDLYRWTERVRVWATISTPSNKDQVQEPKTGTCFRDIEDLQQQLAEKIALYESIDSTYWVLAVDAESKGMEIENNLKDRMNTVLGRLNSLPAQLTEAKLKAANEGVEVTSVLMDTIKFEGAVDISGGVVSPPSPLLPPPKHSASSAIICSLDKSILQIRDWLTVVEQMTRQQTVVVGDMDDVRTLIERHKNVLRELEGKKPQLDELVTTADSIKDDSMKQQPPPRQQPTNNDAVAVLYQFPSQTRLFDHLRTCFKVTKLREHWDETNTTVLNRKTQLDAMLADSHKLETKRAEVEAWLSRMEHRLERSKTLPHTPEMIDQQIREQKGQQAEVQQYKHQLELLNQQTQKLVTIYQQDDTRLIRGRGEALNARFNNLQASLLLRGKALHSSLPSQTPSSTFMPSQLSSSHLTYTSSSVAVPPPVPPHGGNSYDKALEKQVSWLAETEATFNAIEREIDRVSGPMGGGQQQQRHTISRTAAHLKDLQSEIESHKDVVASLNATGQKLLGTLENQEEAMLLHRRLDEMNSRWNTLKHRSIAIRSRLEGNTESWSSLLLSLRELIEWVIRKDTEVTAMGSPVGDLSSLNKYSNDLMTLRRVLDEKQPVVESNLKSGRQLVASEPPLSDTSDSEAGRDVEGDARKHGEESARELTRSVRREVTKLSEKWAALRERVTSMSTNITLAHKKLGVLLKTLEDVDGCIDDADKTVASWGPVPPQEQAEQHVTAVTKFRENLADLQRGIDDVNDQAARFSAHNVPLAPDTSTRLHRLNSRWKTLEGAVNERWRQVAGRSRDITPLTAAQLASSVSQPWERAVANNKVPYYINHAQENTYWDHPEMMALLESLADLNHIKFSAYRTASKLRALQKKLALDEANLQLVTDVFDEHGLRGQNDRLIDVSDMVVVLSTLYGRIAVDRPELNTNLTTDLCLNWLLNVYDSQRTGQMRVLSFRVGLVCLCKGHLEEKYRYMFRLIADPNRLVDQRKLGLLLHDCVQVPRQLGEVAAFGGSNIEPSVRSCFTKAGKDRDAIEAVHFLTWVQQEPQSLVWLAVLHRVAASEQIQHQVKCNICKTSPIIGLRYRCLKCIGFDMCQQCFFDGRSSKSHKITHPMHEYCTATTAGDEMKDFTKALKNKFKSKRSLQKHTKKGYLPVQTVLEGDPLESPSPSPQHAGGASQDVHNRLEQYASRLAEVELRTNSNSTPDSEDEHGLIAQYCQSLSSGDAAAGGGGGGVPLPVPRSPLQVMAAVDADQKDELEQMIRELEEENQALLAEYEQLKQQPEASESSLSSSPLRSEADMLAEARMLRQHKGRLEARMTILEQHNQQLEAQLQRLRHLLQQSGNSPNKSGTLQTKSVTASQLATDSPAKVNGHPSQGGHSLCSSSSATPTTTSAYDGLDQMSEYVRPPPPPMGNVAHVGNLFSRAGDLEKAVGSLVATVNQSPESGQCSGPTDEPPLLQQRQEEEEEEVEDYDNHPAKRR